MHRRKGHNSIGPRRLLSRQDIAVYAAYFNLGSQAGGSRWGKGGEGLHPKILTVRLTA